MPEYRERDKLQSLLLLPLSFVCQGIAHYIFDANPCQAVLCLLRTIHIVRYQEKLLRRFN